MGLGGGAVDHVDIPVGRLHQSVKQSPPDSACRPAMEAIVDRRWWSVAGRTILPPTTRAQHMDDPADDPAVIGAMSAGLVSWKQGGNACPLLIIKPKFTCHGQISRCTGMESQQPIIINGLIGFGA